MNVCFARMTRFWLILGQRNTDIGDRYIEIMVFVDKAAVDKHRNDNEVKRYVLTYLKLVSNFIFLIIALNSKLLFLEISEE